MYKPVLDICVCMYGSGSKTVGDNDGNVLTYADMHRRCIESILKHTSDLGSVRLIVGCNDVDKETVDWLKGLPQPEVVVIAGENIYKYPRMAQMYDVCTAGYIAWFDDDSYVTQPNWDELIVDKLEEGSVRDAVLGKLYTFDLLYGQVEWVKQAPWFQGHPVKTRAQGGKLVPYVSFPTGGFVAMRGFLPRLLGWPDSRLVHNGGDVMFGEAFRQFGYK